jgi:hydroxymethylpyrimidine/phosphomethylpyrimidine kinase
LHPGVGDRRPPGSGADIADAVMGAQEYTWRTLAAGFRPGMGQFIPDRLFWSRRG